MNQSDRSVFEPVDFSRSSNRLAISKNSCLGNNLRGRSSFSDSIGDTVGAVFEVSISRESSEVVLSRTSNTLKRESLCSISFEVGGIKLYRDSLTIDLDNIVTSQIEGREHTEPATSSSNTRRLDNVSLSINSALLVLSLSVVTIQRSSILNKTEELVREISFTDSLQGINILNRFTDRATKLAEDVQRVAGPGRIR